MVCSRPTLSPDYSQAQGDVVDVSDPGGVIASEVVLTLGGGDDDIVVLQGVSSLAPADPELV